MKVQELFETAVPKKPLKFKPVDTAKAIAMLNKHCKNALWMLEKDRPIWRGFSWKSEPEDGFTVIDPTKSERISTNTSNHYTVLLDNNPYNKQIGLPKRSKSLIASTDRSYADRYGLLFAVVPFDTTPIGCVGHDDMWETRMSIFGKKVTIEDLNSLYDSLKIDDTLEAFKKISNEFSTDAKMPDWAFIYIERFLKMKLSPAQKAQIKNDFLGYLLDAYSAKNTGHKVATTATLDRTKDQEVWVGGKCMVIDSLTWHKMRAQLKGEK